MAKQKTYVVFVGRKPGLYKTWADCQKQIHGVAGAKFKGFDLESEAQAAFDAEMLRPKGILPGALSVDAACSGNPGVMEYQAIWVDTRELAFRMGPWPVGTNNIGEFLGLVHALALFEKNNQPDIPIYTDSLTAMAWVREKRAKSNLVRNAKTEALWQLVERAETWLKTNTYKNPILKWETHIWGEVPADFGRKG